MKLADLKIDPDFRNLLPPLDAETYTDLEKDIVSNGVIDPIVTWNGYIVDGHNRYDICKSHRMNEISTKSINKENKSEVMRWIVDHQFARRSLLRSEKMRTLMKVEEQVALEAKDRQRQAGQEHGRGQAEKVTANLPQANDTKRNDTTAGQMAKKIGVSEKTYRDMKTIVTKGTNDQIERMDKGGRGNGISTIAREIKDGTADGERKCKTCQRILPISQFTDKTHPFRCSKCDSERRREYRESLNVMPDSLNPAIPIVVTDEVTIAEFENIFRNMESSLERAFEVNKEYLSESVKDGIIHLIEEHINHINAIKGEIEHETKG